MEQVNNNQNTALLVMDIMAPIVAMIPESAALLDAIAGAITAARNNKLQVIYVVLGFKEGYPEISASNKSFSNIKNSKTALFDTKEGQQVYPFVAPQAGDLVVTKKRVSAFTGSDLEVVLRALNVKNIVLSGISTSGVVLSTLREAADKDYVITVLADCCADPDQQVHDVLTSKVFPRQAEVLQMAEWKALLQV